MSKRGWIGGLGWCLVFVSLPLGAVTCDSLNSLKLADTSITAAENVAPGTFLPPGGAPNPAVLPVYKALPAFCRVRGAMQPSSDSHIEFEVWLPAEGWNGKYMGIGNGGFAGSISYASAPGGNMPGLANALLAGYAASSTDTGHQGGGTDAQWALGHPEKIVDYGYRAIHETAEKSKAIVRAFYGDRPLHSYFGSCSNGGRQALMEAQRFPADYDGIIAGAPANNFTHVLAAFTADIQATEADPASYIPPAKLPAIEAAALAACDALDGLKDGLIDDPRKCHFDPAALVCRGAESDNCLTRPQAAALEKIYRGARTAQGKQIYPGFVPGGETGAGGWAAWVTGSGPGKGAQYAFATQGGAYLIFQNPARNYREFNLDRDATIADQTMGQRLDAVDPDLKAYRDHGGKLILFHGWSDSALAPVNSIEYYESVVEKLGRKDADGFVRLFLAPGMQHCGAGPGPNAFGGPMMKALERWVEQGSAPERIIATRYKTNDPASGAARTRPLCPYPEVARYRGSGSIDDAANFVCRVP
jgi:hypothetical protein